MKNLTDRQKKRIFISIAAFLPLIVITLVMRRPFYYALIFYFLAFLVTLALYFPNYLAVWANLNYIRGNTEKARRLLKSAVDRNTKSPVAHLNYSILLVRDGDGANALKVLEKALALKPKLITEKNIRLTMGSCYWVMKDIDGAIDVYEDMLKRYDYVNAHVLTSLGYMYFLRGDAEKALETTNKALEDSPEYGAAWDNLGQIRYASGDTDEAKRAFETAVSHKADLADSNYYLGLIAEQQNDTEKAREYFTAAHGCKLSALNTVTRDQIEEKYAAYSTE